jgi:hypothetical protein
MYSTTDKQVFVRLVERDRNQQTLKYQQTHDRCNLLFLSFLMLNVNVKNIFDILIKSGDIAILKKCLSSKLLKYLRF